MQVHVQVLVCSVISLAAILPQSLHLQYIAKVEQSKASVAAFHLAYRALLEVVGQSPVEESGKRGMRLREAKSQLTTA